MAVIKERIVADQAVLKRRVGVLGVHSIDHFAFEVPDLDEARKFYETFGLDVRDEAGGLGLYTFDHPHRWGLVTAGSAKRLRYLSFRSEEHTSELQSQMSISYAVFCLKQQTT